MKIAIAADHAGLEYKTILIPELQQAGYEVYDLATAVSELILQKNAERGILICGSGVGVSVAANKYKGIRAGVCHDTYSAHQCVEHDDANVICIGQRVIGIEVAREVVFAFLKAQFSHEVRHQRRIDKILAIENKNMKEETI